MEPMGGLQLPPDPQLQSFLASPKTNVPIFFLYYPDTKRIANISNNYFSTIGRKTLAKTKYLYKNYTDYLTNKIPNSSFLS